MKHITVNTAQKNFFTLFNDVTLFNEPTAIVSDDNKTAVIINIDDWNNIQETLYLYALPGMVESIKDAAAEPLNCGIP
ncbi:MAG: type II toxin-antitoxin system Phd/YefM family antitoxin, partial [Clostridiales bacterium]|nr:type II toxin-antitoxin system Phd/YefM family antitoxin [Clostridiales bacterium]